MKHYQVGNQAIAEPEKMIVAAMIQCALKDAQGTNSVVNEQDVFTARHFLASDLFIELCDWLGVPPRIRRQTVANAFADIHREEGDNS